MTGSRIVGSGSALPEQIVTNHDLAARVDTSDEWIIERTGIRQRHIADEGETTSTLAIAAARAALADAGLTPAASITAARAFSQSQAQNGCAVWQGVISHGQ